MIEWLSLFILLQLESIRIEPDVACLYYHKDLAPFSANAASGEQAATVNLIKHKRD